jgi:hypothetical protein
MPIAAAIAMAIDLIEAMVLKTTGGASMAAAGV